MSYWEEVEEEEVKAEEHPIISLATKAITSEAKKISKLVSEDLLLKVRKTLLHKGLIKRIPKIKRKDVCGLALDTGFTDPPLELTGGKLAIILRSHVTFGCNVRSVGKAETKGFVRFIQGDEFKVKPLSKIVERRFILKLLEDKRRGLNNIDLILIDGELFPRIPPGYERGDSLVHKLYGEYIKLTDKILKLADDTDTAIVGVVKRVYGSDIPIIAGVPEVKVNDKALATYILEPGEWIDLKTYVEIAYEIDKHIKKGKITGDRARSLTQRSRWLVAVMEYVEQAPNIEVAVYKATVPTFFMIATKVEIWSSMMLHGDELIAYLSSITGVNGVPYPIDLVDSMCRVTPELLHTIQQQLYQELDRIVKNSRLALSIVGLINPEKMRVIGIK